MSESEERSSKKIRVNCETDSSPESEGESSYDGCSDSYVIVSSNELLSEDSTSSGSEEDYFTSTGDSEVEEESEIAWTDSDSNSKLREELQEDAPWISSEGLAKTVRRDAKNIAFKYTRHVFTARCKVKLLRCFPHIKVLVDSFNLIYMIKDFDSFKTYKVDMFKISDVCFFGNRILFSSSSSSYIKEVSVDGKVTDIRKGMGNVQKMIADDNLYILGDKLFVLNQSLSIKNEFDGSFVDGCVNEGNVICLKDNGDIYVFDKELHFRRKLSFSFKFQFKRLYSANSKVLVCTGNGMIVLNSSLEEIRSFSNLSEPITALVSNSDFIVHGSSYQNSLRILKDNLSYFDKFPFSKIKINPISAMAIDKDVVYFNDSRFISSLKLSYV